MSIVTIQNVLDAGGEIFGLPVETQKGKGICVVTRADINYKEISINRIPEDKRAYYSCQREPVCEAIVYADGIRVLEIDGKLYRVTGHKLGDFPDAYALLEPLIPDKPAGKFKVGDYVKVVKKGFANHRAVIGNIYRVLYVMNSGDFVFLDSGDCKKTYNDKYIGCFYAADELELAEKPAAPEDSELRKLVKQVAELVQEICALMRLEK